MKNCDVFVKVKNESDFYQMANLFALTPVVDNTDFIAFKLLSARRALPEKLFVSFRTFCLETLCIKENEYERGLKRCVTWGVLVLENKGGRHHYSWTDDTTRLNELMELSPDVLKKTYDEELPTWRRKKAEKKKAHPNIQSCQTESTPQTLGSGTEKHTPRVGVRSTKSTPRVLGSLKAQHDFKSKDTRTIKDTIRVSGSTFPSEKVEVADKIPVQRNEQKETIPSQVGKLGQSEMTRDEEKSVNELIAKREQERKEQEKRLEEEEEYRVRRQRRVDKAFEKELSIDRIYEKAKELRLTKTKRLVQRERSWIEESLEEYEEETILDALEGIFLDSWYAKETKQLTLGVAVKTSNIERFSCLTELERKKKEKLRTTDLGFEYNTLPDHKNDVADFYKFAGMLEEERRVK